MSELRRRMMVGAASIPPTPSGYEFIIVCEYESTTGSYISVVIGGVERFRVARGQARTYDIGIFTFGQSPYYPYDQYILSPEEEYLYKGTIYQQGTPILYNYGDTASDSVLLPNHDEYTSMQYDFEFDYNGGGNGRRIRFGVNGFSIGRWWQIYESFNNDSVLYTYDFLITRIGAATDYFAVQALRPFECDGVIYNTGDMMHVPWIDASTVISKTITML